MFPICCGNGRRKWPDLEEMKNFPVVAKQGALWFYYANCGLYTEFLELRPRYKSALIITFEAIDAVWRMVHYIDDLFDFYLR